MPFPASHRPEWAVAACACICLAPAAANAQILDRIEVSRANGKAEIRIDFAVQVQYLSHTPPGKGRELNVFIRPINAPPPGSEATEEAMTSPQTDLVPAFSVLYPHLGNAVSIRFAQETEWTIRPNADGRSIVITLPVIKGARDIVSEVRAIPAPPKPAAAATEPTPTPIQVPAPAAVAPAAPAPAPIVPAPAAAVTALPAAPAPTVAPVPPPSAPALEAPAAPPAPVAGAAPAQEAPVAPVEPADAGPTAPTLTPAQIESLAKGFLDDARKAIADNDLPRAINRLNRTLGLPTNAQTEAAQALIGEVREKNGEIAKAKAEYELYLKLYPKGTETKRVQERLAALPSAAARTPSRSRPLVRGPAEWVVYGSLSQYYYTGRSHIEVTTPPPPGLLDFTTYTLSQTDQKSLITNLDVNARKRDGITDTRIVFRDMYNLNQLHSDRTYNRLYSAYVEQTDKELGYFVRAGRQSPTGSGVMERFDGINAGYNFADRWRLNGVAGYAVEFLSPWQKTFYGTSVEMQPQPDSVGLTGYVIRQNLDGLLNRQAVGLESRYFDMHTTAFSMLDYDTLYKGVNIFMLQGNYRTDDGMNIFTYIDHRKAPAYSLTSTYSLWNGMTLKDAVTAVGIEQMRADARLLTAKSNLLSVGFTIPVSQKWQLGADYRAASISGTQEVAAYPTADNPFPDKIVAQPSSGTSHVVGLQAIGTTLFGGNHVAVINTNYIKNPTYNGQALGGNFVFQPNDAWRFDFNLRYYQQKDNQDEKQVRLSPSLRFGYRWEQMVSIEAEFGQEEVKIDGPTRIERDKRTYFYTGYRIDLR